MFDEHSAFGRYGLFARYETEQQHVVGKQNAARTQKRFQARQIFYVLHFGAIEKYKIVLAVKFIYNFARVASN